MWPHRLSNTTTPEHIGIPLTILRDFQGSGIPGHLLHSISPPVYRLLVQTDAGSTAKGVWAIPWPYKKSRSLGRHQRDSCLPFTQRSGFTSALKGIQYVPSAQLEIDITTHLHPRQEVKSNTSWDILLAAISQYFSSSSIPIAFRLRSFAARRVVPDPIKGSRIVSSGPEARSTNHNIHRRGLGHGCPFFCAKAWDEIDAGRKPPGRLP